MLGSEWRDVNDVYKDIQMMGTDNQFDMFDSMTVGPESSGVDPTAPSKGTDYGSLVSLFAGLGAANSAIAGYAEYRAGQMKQYAYEYDAQITLENMRQEEQATQEKYEVLAGAQRSKYAHAGVDIASGSPLLTAVSTAMAASEQQQRIKKAGEEKAGMDRYYGEVAAWSGKQSGVNTFLSGLTKVSGSLMGSMKGGFGTPAVT